MKKIIFSSSATVYGDPAFVPITEDCPKGKITNPYGQTKSMLEQILTDLHTADPEWSVILLRYFNPVGAHKSGLIGEPDVRIYNLGTGKGFSVLQMIEAFSKACGKQIPYAIKPRRPGDIAECYADAALAKKELGWEAERGIDEMCEDSWRWQSNNPNGYR